MLYRKDKEIVRVDRGSGRKILGPLRGRIENIVITPIQREHVIYDFLVLDSEFDVSFFKENIAGRFCCLTSIPAGKSHDENIILVIENASHNIDFKIILLTREK